MKEFNLYEIDLHGVRHSEVKRQLDIFIWQGMQKGRSEIHVVTGISSAMKTLVEETASDYGMKCEETWGNPGSMIISLK